MAFLEKEDLKSNIRLYQLDAITDNDDEIVADAINAGVDEVSDFFVPNEKKEWADGRPIYDVDAIFSATGNARHSLLLAYTKTVTMWHLIGLCNTGLDYTDAKDRYDRAIVSLKSLAKGDKNSRSLPRKPVPDPVPDEPLPLRSGSNKKFNSSF